MFRQKKLGFLSQGLVKSFWLLAFSWSLPVLTSAKSVQQLEQKLASGKVTYIYGEQTQKTWQPLSSGTFRIETESNGRALFDLGPFGYWQVLPSTNALIPDWNGSASPPMSALELLSGTMRVKNPSLDTAVQVVTPIARFSVTGSDVLFTWNRDKNPALLIEVREGQLNISSEEFEQKFVLSRHESVGFEPLWEKTASGKELMFDLLLNNKRKIRGTWSEKKALDKKHFSWLEKEEKALEHQAKIEKKKKEEKLKPPPGTLCLNPWGKLNDCVWKCEGTGRCHVTNPKAECTRKRCLASGAWGNPATLKASQFKCEDRTLIGPCDY